MTKEDFEKYTKTTAICSCCGRVIDIRIVSYSKLRADGTLSRCPVCDWKYRNGDIAVAEGYTLEQSEYALEFLMLQKSIYVNDLAKSLELPLHSALELIRSLKVGNKSFRIKCNCSFCGKEVVKPANIYESNAHIYCSRECYWKHKPETLPHGEASPFYNRVQTTCTNCGKDIAIAPFRNNKTNSFGDNHNFCSHECYWKFRSLYYNGERSPQFGVKFTPERMERHRRIMVQNSRSGSRFDSAAQLLVNGILDKNNISYKREYIIEYFAIDNYLADHGLIIEVNGDYWHSSPLRYNDHKYGINEIQRRTLHHDKLKHSYIKNHLGVEILYLWEKDVHDRADVCEQLILEYVKSGGQLKNYHSFNYHLDRDILTLNCEIITPYQEQDIESYRHLFKDKAG